MTTINHLKTLDRDVIPRHVWELRRKDPAAFRVAVSAYVTDYCRDRLNAVPLDCGRCFTYSHFDGAFQVTGHLADCPIHGTGHTPSQDPS